VNQVVYARRTRYALAIQQKPKKVVTSLASASTQALAFTHQTHQKGNLSEESSEDSSEKSHQWVEKRRNE
jgi:hypothetical protein